jgi:hypothetical protein
VTRLVACTVTGAEDTFAQRSNRRRGHGVVQINRVVLITVAASALLFCGRAHSQENLGWPAIDPADLKLTDNPKEPGGQAMVLEYWVDTDNLKSTETIGVRIKVLREGGLKYANIEIPYLQKISQVEDIRARTVSPEGQAAEFSGIIYDKEIIRGKKYKLNAKALALSNVQVGSIIEYRYRLRRKQDFPDVVKHRSRYVVTEPIAYPAATWEVQWDIFVRHVSLTLHAYSGSVLKYCYIGTISAPADATIAGGPVHLELRDIPGYVEEESAPPESALRGKIIVNYTYLVWDAKSFWRSVGREDGKLYAEFLKKSGQSHREVQRLVGPTDTPEQKLRKLYDRTQQIRMVSFDEAKTEKEKKREQLKENKGVDDVLSRNYAYGNEVNLVFIALARAAGFTAYPVRVVSRDNTLFQMAEYDPAQFTGMVVEVLLDGNRKYFDPATLYCPFGLLPWPETDTVGLVADLADPRLIEVSGRPSNEAVTRRSGELKMDVDGNVEGEVHLRFEGEEALTWRISERNQDEPARKKSLEEWMKASLPEHSESSLTESAGWRQTEGAVTATFHVKTPGYANSVGQRLVVPVVYFQSPAKKALFSSARRVHPVQFRCAAQTLDELTIALPEGFLPEAVPAAKSRQQGIAKFSLQVENQNQKILVQRSVDLNGSYFPVEQYPALKLFYQETASADEAQLSLRRSAVKAAGSQ